jgi:peptidoglycan/LPS O-acetylase OafA/YrhL
MSNMTNPLNRSDVSDWYAKTNHFECLNGLRAISIIAVVWHHTASSDSHFLKLLGYGYQGVTFFFLISGFLITTLLLKERDKTGKIDLTAFFARRSLRIFPLYFGVLLAYCALVYIQERHTEAGAAFFSNLKYFATYTSNLFVPLDGRVIFYFAWSLAAEEQFYLMLAPLLAICSPKKAAIFIALICVALVAANLFGAGNPAFLAKVAPLGIWLGTATAFLLRSAKAEPWIQTFFAQRWSSPVLAVLALYLLETNGMRGIGFVICAAAFLIACLVTPPKGKSSVLSQTLLVHIGKVSYGIYLLHMICKALVSKSLVALGLTPPSEIVFLVVLVVTAIVATFSFNTFEKFFLEFKAKFVR